MGDQMSFGDLESQGQRRKTRREEFLERMDAIVPWDRWTALIEPHYHSQQRGRHVRGAEAMLRMYLLQVMFGLSDEGTEDAILDSRAMQRFMHIDLMREQVPDATTLAKFRHILERKGLGKAMLDELNSELEAAGVMMRGGSIVDATFIEAPSSTKNEGHSRDPEAHRSKKGKNWHFGFKAHIGVDAGSGLVHTVETTAANVSDVAMAHSLVRGDDRFCYADSGYTGVAKRPEVASDPHLSSMRWTVARKPSTVKGLDCALSAEKGIESRKASVRSKVEHPFLIVKRRFGHIRTRYRGIEKNGCLLHAAFALSNLAMCISAGRALEPLPTAA
jgi:transposase, IS5 family